MQIQGSDITETPEIIPKRGNPLEVLAIFIRLGLAGQLLILATFAKKSSFDANGSMNAPMATCLDCASFCLGQQVVRLASH
jgi:hypothetical protein